MVLRQKIWLLQSRPPLGRLVKAAAWANILALFVGVLAWLHPGSNVASPRASDVDQQVTDGLTITQPNDGAAADETVELRALTTFADKNHYIIVQPPLGAPVIQDEPMRVSPDGEVTGRAVLGSNAVGAGEEFTIHVLATGTALHSGARSVPPDAKFSNPVTVKRKRKGA